MTRCLLGIGANLGEPARQIAQAVDQLARQDGVQLQAVSRSVITAPVGGPPGQPAYRNAAVLIETSLAPDELLAKTRAIEHSIGRVRAARWDARVIDIDLLLYGDAVIRRDELRVPHPWMVARAFVLQPAAEVAPDLRHPVLGWTLGRLWQHLQSATPRFALVGCADRPSLAELARQLPSVFAQARLEPPPEYVPPPHAFAPVADLPRQLEWLERRVELLSAARWNETTPERAQLCPFWLDESLVWAQATLEPDDLRQFEQQFARVAQSIHAPKLVILATGFWSTDERRERPSVDQLRDDCCRRLIARDASPYVEVETNRTEDFVREVLGAMSAMQIPALPAST
jgi:2-amino-4-hydroxy-6-hydroxymethyldihydropteridine diphosphokinase